MGRPAPSKRKGNWRCCILCMAMMRALSSFWLKYWSSSMSSATGICGPRQPRRQQQRDSASAFQVAAVGGAFFRVDVEANFEVSQRDFDSIHEAFEDSQSTLNF